MSSTVGTSPDSSLMSWNLEQVRELPHPTCSLQKEELSVKQPHTLQRTGEAVGSMLGGKADTTISLCHSMSSHEIRSIVILMDTSLIIF